MIFNKVQVKKDSIYMLVLSVISVLFILVCSVTTTPILPTTIAGDSAMFQTIGKYWAEGVLPYVELWDSKGPVIFFINAVGYFLTGSKNGVFFLQIVNMVVSELIVYKIFRREFKSLSSFMWSVLFLISLTLDYQCGNTVEEYCLPLLLLSLYFFLKWSDECIKKKSVEHAPLYAFVYGLYFAFSFLTRITNAIGVCAGILVITIVLISKKKWKNLSVNAISFLMGVLILSLPFIIYFYFNNALSEFWYGTIAYNLEYAGNSGLNLSSKSSWDIVALILGYSNSFILFIIGIFETFKCECRKRAGILWSVISLFTAVYLVKSNGYLHYAIIAAPYFLIIIIELHRLYIDVQSDIWKKIIKIAKAFVCFVALLSGLMGLRNDATEYYYIYWNLPNQLSEEPLYTALELCEQIPENEKDSFVAYNCKDGIYLHLDVCPYYRFFTMQDWAASCGLTLKDKVIDTYENGDVKWILITSSADADVYDIITSMYYLVDEKQIPYSDNYYQLFRLKEE